MKIAIAAGAGLLVSLAPTGGAQAAPLKTSHYTIHAMAMAPAEVSSGTNYAITWTDGIRNMAAEAACFHAAVSLPHRATITRVMVWYTGTAPGEAGETYVSRQGFADETTSPVFYKSLPRTGGQRRGVNVPLSTDQARLPAEAGLQQDIDNARFGYVFGICLIGLNKAAFHSARITYTHLD